MMTLPMRSDASARLFSRRALAVLTLIFCHSWIPVASARDLPLWDLGLGIAALSIPDYRGSSENEDYVLPFPYFVYRGETFRVDRDGITGGLFRSDRVRVDLSLNIGQPTDSDRNDARQGMPDLDATFEIGPSLKILLSLNEKRTAAWSLQFPVRAVYATDLHDAEFVGWIFSPHLNFENHNFGPGGYWDFEASIGPVYATQEYNDYFYSVAPQYATPARPAYQAAGGYSGYRVTLSLSKRFSLFWVGAFTRYDNLHGAVFDDSPLVTQDYSLMAGVGLAWIITTSKTTVKHDPRIWW